VETIDPDTHTRELNLPDNIDKGTVVIDVTPGSSAAKAGMERLDTCPTG